MVFKIFFNLINIIVKGGRKPGAILLERSEKSLRRDSFFVRPLGNFSQRGFIWAGFKQAKACRLINIDFFNGNFTTIKLLSNYLKINAEPYLTAKSRYQIRLMNLLNPATAAG